MDCLASLALHAVASTSSFETAVTPRVHRRPRARLPRLTSPLPSHPPSYERPTEVARRSTPQVARAVDFLGDADTVGAVAGQIAGATYGEAAIDPRHLAALARFDRGEIRCRACLSFLIGRQARRAWLQPPRPPPVPSARDARRCPLAARAADFAPLLAPSRKPSGQDLWLA